MVEPGKAEESQRPRPRGHASRSELEGVVSHIREVFGDSARLNLRLGAAGVDPSVVHVVVEASPAEAEAEAGQASATTEASPSAFERDMLVEKDDAYYDEVRQAVGGGTRSVLLGTSTRSLERNLRKLKDVQQAYIDQRPSSSIPEGADLTEILRASVAAAKAGRTQPRKRD